MDVSVTVKPVANDGHVHWIVYATLDSPCPGFVRRHFVVGANSEQEALGVAGDVLALSSWLSQAEHLVAQPMFLSTLATDPECPAHAQSQCCVAGCRRKSRGEKHR